MSIESHELHPSRGRGLGQRCWLVVCIFFCTLLLVTIAFALFRLSVRVQCSAECRSERFNTSAVHCDPHGYEGLQRDEASTVRSDEVSETHDRFADPVLGTVESTSERSDVLIAPRRPIASLTDRARGSAVTAVVRSIGAMERQGEQQGDSEPRPSQRAEVPISVEERQELAAEARARRELSYAGRLPRVVFGVLSHACEQLTV